MHPARAIVTKVDRDPATGAFDRDRVLRSFEESLEPARRRPRRASCTCTTRTPCRSRRRWAPAAPSRASASCATGRVDAIGVAAGPIPLDASLRRRRACSTWCSAHNRFTLVDRSATPLFLEAAAPRHGRVQRRAVRRRHPRARRTRRRFLRLPARRTPSSSPGSEGRGGLRSSTASRSRPRHCTSRCARRSSTPPSSASRQQRASPSSRGATSSCRQRTTSTASARRRRRSATEPRRGIRPTRHARPTRR